MLADKLIPELRKRFADRPSGPKKGEPKKGDAILGRDPIREGPSGTRSDREPKGRSFVQYPGTNPREESR